MDKRSMRRPDALLSTTSGERSITPERKRLVVLGVVLRPDGVLVIQAACDDNRRRQWEGEFRRLIGSFKLEE